MKRIFTFFLVLFCVFSLGFTQNTKSNDVVILLDTSSSMLPYFQRVCEQVLPGVAESFIRLGDTIHLISFNSQYHLELAKNIKTKQDVEDVVSRFMLLYPLGKETDFISALQYTERYTKSLGLTNNKTIIVVSDGIHAPKNNFSLEVVKTQVDSIATNMKNAGWDVYFIKIPYPQGLTVVDLSGKNITNVQPETDPLLDISGDFATVLGIDPSSLPDEYSQYTIEELLAMPSIKFPQDIGESNYQINLPLEITNKSEHTINLELSGVYLETENSIIENSFISLKPGEKGTLYAKLQVPSTYKEGKQKLTVDLLFSDNVRTVPQSGSFYVTLVSSPFADFFKNYGHILLAIFLILLAILLVILLAYLIHKKTSNTSAVKTVNNTNNNRVYGEKDLSEQERRNSTLTSYKNNDNRQAILQGYKGDSRDRTLTAAERSRIEMGEPQKKHYLSGNEISDSRDRMAILNSAVVGSKNIPIYEGDKSRAERYKYLSSYASSNTKNSHVHRNNMEPANPNDPITIVQERKTLLKIEVKNQSHNIGKRNVHLLKAGNRLSIGGTPSSFLIFLVEFPHKIAEIRFNGSQCDLAILKPDYFPYEKKNIIQNCVNKEFIIVSDKGYEVSFSFSEYEDPVKKLNDLLTSIQYED